MMGRRELTMTLHDCIERHCLCCVRRADMKCSRLSPTRLPRFTARLFSLSVTTRIPSGIWSRLYGWIVTSLLDYYILNSTGPTRTSSPTSARGSSRGSRPAALAWPVQLVTSQTDLSADFCPTRAFPREDVRWGCARVQVYVYCTW